MSTTVQTRLGAEHPDVAALLNNSAGLYLNQGRYAEAEPLYQQALAIAQQRLGATHPTTRLIERNLQDLQSCLAAQSPVDQF